MVNISGIISVKNRLSLDIIYMHAVSLVLKQFKSCYKLFNWALISSLNIFM